MLHRILFEHFFVLLSQADDSSGRLDHLLGVLHLRDKTGMLPVEARDDVPLLDFCDALVMCVHCPPLFVGSISCACRYFFVRDRVLCS